MTSTWHRDAIHELILAEASKLWRKSQRNSFWSYFLGRIFRTSRPNALYIQEYSDADWTSGACKGDLLGTWVLDDRGFRSAEAPLLDPASHKQFERLIFHSVPESAAMTHYYSPYGGFGHIMRIETRSGRQVLIPSKTWIF